ncbi:hypothetical protein GYMLUDRAFT_909685 [Collybiopsis luxurians FD-317 M1]|nr:hypothetical protein GYMLUDRAFT_909685 [Collybiopsis luxurians FD-317 M1]
MKTPPCIVSGNPDVTGIGVRLALYFQSFSIVCVSAIVAEHSAIPDSLAGAWRVQFYYTLAIIAAVVIQRVQGQISMFHEFAAFNMAYMSFMSGFAAAGSEFHAARRRNDRTVSPNGHVVAIKPLNRPISGAKKTLWIVTRFPGTALGMVQGGRVVFPLLLIWETISLSNGCTANPEFDDSRENQVLWWFIGAHLNIVKMFYMPLAIFFMATFLNFLGPVIRLSSRFGYTRWRGRRLMGWMVEFMVLLVGTEVSIGINHLENVEDEFGFGQVIPLVLLIPVLETWYACWYPSADIETRTPQSSDEENRIPPTWSVSNLNLETLPTRSPRASDDLVEILSLLLDSDNR